MSAPFKRKLRGFLQKNAPLMITCRELEEFVSGYLDGTLPARQRFLFRLHLALCRECRDYLVSFRDTIELGRAVFERGDEPVPDEVPEDLVRAILSSRRSGK